MEEKVEDRDIVKGQEGPAQKLYFVILTDAGSFSKYCITPRQMCQLETNTADPSASPSPCDRFSSSMSRRALAFSSSVKSRLPRSVRIASILAKSSSESSLIYGFSITGACDVPIPQFAEPDETVSLF